MKHVQLKPRILTTILMFVFVGGLKAQIGDIQDSPDIGYELGGDTVQYGTELIFSEYMEGGDDNQALEIFNPTDHTINLEGYKIKKLLSDCDMRSAQELELKGTIPSLGVYVVTNSNADIEILEMADTLGDRGVLNFDGSNQLILAKEIPNRPDAIIDRIGYCTAWDYFADKMVLVRDPAITEPNPEENDPVNNGEWHRFSPDSTCYLGYPWLISSAEEMIKAQRSSSSGGSDFFGFLAGYKNTPKTPSAAGLTPRGTYSSNMYNGMVNVNIPLTTLSSRELSIPVGLSYANNGIKVDQAATWVGLGWNLNAGGAITRSVRGFPDNYYGNYEYIKKDRDWDVKKLKSKKVKGYLYEGWQYSRENLENTSNEFEYFIRKTSFKFNDSEVHDAQPDVYHFAAGDITGTFYIKSYTADGSGNITTDIYTPVITCNKNVTIDPIIREIPHYVECTGSEHECPDPPEIEGYEIRWEGFVITTPEGYKYEFGTTKNTREYTKTIQTSSNYYYSLEKEKPDNLPSFLKNSGNTPWYPLNSENMDNNDIDINNHYIKTDYYKTEFERDSVSRYIITSEHNYISTWYLRKITSPNEDFVLFNYEKGETYSYYTNANQSMNVTSYRYLPNSIGHMDYSGDGSDIDLFVYPTHLQKDKTSLTFSHSKQVVYNSKCLTSIEAANGNMLVFNSSGERTDLPGACRLNSIDLYTLGTKTKSYEFGYYLAGAYDLKIEMDKLQLGYKKNPSEAEVPEYYSREYQFEDANGFQEHLKSWQKRLFLTRITEKDSAGNSLPPYKFEYNSTKLPMRFSYHQNHYGYYNYNSRGLKYPNVEIDGWEFEYESDHHNCGYGKWFIDNNPSFLNTEKNEFVEDHPSMKAGILEEVIFPTGGRKKYEYITIGEYGVFVDKIKTYNHPNAQPEVTDYSYHGQSLAFEPEFSEKKHYSSKLKNVYTQTGNDWVESLYFRGSKINFADRSLEPQILSGNGILGFDKVSTINKEGQGKVEYEFTNLPDENASLYNENSGYDYTIVTPVGFYPPKEDRSFERGKLILNTVKDNSNKDLVTKRNYYNTEGQTNLLNGFVPYEEISKWGDQLNSMSSVAIYDIGNKWSWLKKTEKTVEKENGSMHYVSKKQIDPKKKYVKTTQSKDTYQAGITGSDYNLVTERTYTGDFNLTSIGNSSDTMIIALKSMQDNHWLNYPVEIIEKKNGKVLSGKLLKYKTITREQKEYFYPAEKLTLVMESPVPEADFDVCGYEYNGADSEYQFVYENKDDNDGCYYEPMIYYDHYNSYGKLVESHDKNNVYSVTIWSYNHSYPVAKITNATREEVLNALGYTAAGDNWTNVEDELGGSYTETEQASINGLRSALPDADITTYTYEPGFGVKTKTAPNGLTTYYHYDGFGRLKLVEDDDKHVVKKVDYNYGSEIKIVGGIEGPDAACNGIEQEYFVNMETAASYNWTVENAVDYSEINGSNGEKGIKVTFGDQDVTIQFQAVNGFGDTKNLTKTVSITTEKPQISISGSRYNCEGDIRTYNGEVTNGTDYDWLISGAADYHISENKKSATVEFGTSNVDISLTSNNCIGTTTNSRTLQVVTSPPGITHHPTDKNVMEGDLVTLFARASSNVRVEYQWYREFLNKAEKINEATGSSYSFTASKTYDGVSYFCRVSTCNGQNRSNTQSAKVNVEDLFSIGLLDMFFGWNADTENEIHTVTVDTEKDWTYTVNDSWISVLNVTSNSVDVTVSSNNTSGSSRQGSITFSTTDNQQSETLNVIQHEKIQLTASPDQISFYGNESGQSDAKTASIVSKSVWSVKTVMCSGVNWLAAVKSDDKTLTLHPKFINDSGSQRQATVTLENNEGTTEEIVVTQSSTQ